MQGDSGELFSSVKETFFSIFPLLPLLLDTTTEMHHFNLHATDVKSSPCVRTTSCCYIYKRFINFHKLSKISLSLCHSSILTSNLATWSLGVQTG